MNREKLKRIQGEYEERKSEREGEGQRGAERTHRNSVSVFTENNKANVVGVMRMP